MQTQENVDQSESVPLLLADRVEDAMMDNGESNANAEVVVYAKRSVVCSIVDSKN